MRVWGVFFTGCGLRQQDALKIFNPSMDLFLMNCIIFKVTKTFHTALMNNLILLWKIVNYNILYSFEQFVWEAVYLEFWVTALWTVIHLALALMNIQFIVLFIEYCHRSTYIAWTNNYYLKSTMNTALMNNYLRSLWWIYCIMTFYTLLTNFIFLRLRIVYRVLT